MSTLRHAGQFESVIDVAAAGADPNGDRPLNEVLDRVAADDTLLYLPEGRYRMDRTWGFYDFSNFGIVGENATIVPPEGNNGVLFALGRPGRATGLLFEGVTFDFRAERTGGRPLLVKVADKLAIRDVAVVGTQDVESPMMRFDVTSEQGSGIVERMRLPDGAIASTGGSGCLVGDTNRGDLTFVDCHIAGFPDNGLYAGPPAGTMRVIGGRYENNNVSNVRVKGDALVRGVHVRCDRAPEGFGNMRGIRLRGGSRVVVEDCTVEFTDVVGSDGAIVLASEMNAATIRRTRVRIDTDDIAAILAKDPRKRGTEQWLRCEDVCITGTAAGSTAVRVQGRDDCVFDRMRIHQTGDNRDGIVLTNSVGNVTRNSEISVTGNPIVRHNAELKEVDLVADRSPVDTTPDCG